MSDIDGQLDRPRAHAHLLQLYGNNERLLIRNVAQYMAEGLIRGESAVVIATPHHTGRLLDLLRAVRLPVEDAVAAGRLVLKDAEATLETFVVDGLPDWDRFDAAVGELIRAMQDRARPGGVRAYGEMVNVLWLQGNRSAAIQLEDYWNDLLRANTFQLYCGYSIDLFSPDFPSAVAAGVLRTHNHIISSVEDARLRRAIDQAIVEVLGTGGAATAAAVADLPPAHAKHPAANVVLWLRQHAPAADAILNLAREFYEASDMSRSTTVGS